MLEGRRRRGLHDRALPLSVLGVDVSVDLLVLGAVRGLIIGLIAVGLVLVFRASRVVNLAHIQTGTLGAALVGRLVVDLGVPFAVALPLGLAAGAAIGAATELLVVRRLAAVPRVVLLVATIGVGQLMLVVEASLPTPRANPAFPSPLSVQVELVSTRIESPELMVLILVPAVVAGLAAFLARTPTGLAVRASAGNPDAAELAGIPVRRVASVVWAIAGALAVLGASLSLAVDRTPVAQDTFGVGPTLLLAALTAALAGGLASLPLALIGGLGVGLLTALLQFNGAQPGEVSLAVFGALLVLLGLRVALQRARAAGDGETVTLTLGRLPRPVPRALRANPAVRRLTLLTSLLCLALAAALPLVTRDAGTLFLASRLLLFALLALSLTVLTGWAGQLSLGQVALFGIGAFAVGKLVAAGVPFAVAVPGAAFVGALAALVVGAPALLLRGLFLGVATFGFAVACREWLFTRGFLGEQQGGLVIPRPTAVAGNSAYYLLCLGVLAACATAIGHLRGTGAARRLIAARANPDRAASLTVGTVPARLVAYALSGALAGLAGGLYAGLSVRVTAAQFPAYDSLVVVALVAVGGFGSVSGALLGAVVVLAVPAAYGNSLVSTFLVSGVGLLVVLLYLPGGAASLVYAARDAAFDLLAARTRPDPAPAPESPPVTTAAPPPRARAQARDVPRPAPDEAALAARGITVRFGGREALRGVDLAVHRGEVLGVIGSNGAGKSTLLGVLSGFVRASGGQVELAGRDVTRASPATRASLGLGRVFQDASLFGDLTVRETLQVALEARERSEVIPSLLALPRSRAAERRKRNEADEVIALLGLGRYAELPVSRASTGTRRVVELGCLVAQRATVLLLDEPTAGLAQRESEAFAPLLLRLRADLGATVVLVEHDIPLVTAVSDRLQCLGEGQTIALGTPADVVRDPAVVASYLGTDDRAIRRSGALPAVAVRA